MKAHLTRRYMFSASHPLHRAAFSDDENRRVYGKCNNPHGHGHNYVLEVTVSAEIDEFTGFSVNLPELDVVLDREIRMVFDHQHINHAIPEFNEGRLIPTSENILTWCWPRLAHALGRGVTLRRLRLHEDDTFYVDYFGGPEQ